jgi:PAS domain S-box-containing protein
VAQACLVAALSYVAARLGGALILRPQMVSPLWLGNVVLASMLLLVRRRTWPVLLAAGLAGFLLDDVRAGVPIRSEVWLILSNAVEVLVAAFCLSNAFDGMLPRLNSVRTLARYSFYAVFLAPFVGAFPGALSTSGNYWAAWKLAFFSEALGFLTLMPAILGWAREIRATSQKPRAYYLEGSTLLVALVILGYLIFDASAKSDPPALLYSLVPLLLWSTLRFGSTGVSTSMIAIAFVSIWGVVHGRGPFTEPGAPINVLSLQLFLFFTAAPFMALAVLVEERKDAEQALRQREVELKEAQRLAKVGSWQWDIDTDAVTWSEEFYRIAGLNPGLPAVTYAQHSTLFTPESWLRLQCVVEEALRTGTPYELDLEMKRADGRRSWIVAKGEVRRDGTGRVVQLRGTVQDITGRKQAQEELRESEERFRLVADTAPALIWMSGTDKLCTFFNKGWLDFTGRSIDLELGNGWAEGVHPEDFQKCIGTYTQAFDRREEFRIEYRLRRHDGEYRWLIDIGVPRFDKERSFRGYIGIGVDMTERKQAEEALSGVSRKLIGAHEEERTRIARDLHDDINQRLALLAVGLEQVEQLERSPSKLPGEVSTRIHELSESITEIGIDIQAISHRLHSSKLEYLGIVTAARSFCKEFAEQQKVEVFFAHEDIPHTLPLEISLSLFRVLQEALQNAVKHSGVMHFEVALRHASDSIDLTVHDSGRGFDVKEAIQAKGLGLISMEERLKLVHGQLFIESQPKHGTTIHAHVPLSARSNAMRATGQASVI